MDSLPHKAHRENVVRFKLNGFSFLCVNELSGISSYIFVQNKIHRG